MEAYVSVDGEQTQEVVEDQDKNMKSGFNAYNNLWLRFSEGLITITCNLEWTAKIGCGTYAQVHFPYSEPAIIKTRVQDLSQSINIAIEQLCAGPFHIWLVYYTRIGKVVKAVQPFFVSFPFCTCS